MKRPDSTGGAALAAGLSPAQWAEFLGRHDPVWELLPDCWEHGAFIGDGLQGAMIHLDGEGEARRLFLARLVPRRKRGEGTDEGYWPEANTA